MRSQRTLCWAIVACGALLLAVSAAMVAQAPPLTPEQALGKAIFFDEDLSINQNQSCASCHDPAWGWTGPHAAINAGGSVYEGSITGRFGDRKPPSSAYATPSPLLHYIADKDDALFVGGNFWDGRATGAKLGNPAADQAQGPFLNPMEQALPDSACVVYRVCEATYPVTFASVYGATMCAITWPSGVQTACAAEDVTVALSTADRAKVEAAYDKIALAIAAFEGSPESNAFSSKFDAYRAGAAALSKEEKQGLNLFNGKGKCSRCHPMERGRRGEAPLFTDFTYDNLGLPKNPDNPVYDRDPGFVDPGLGGFLASLDEYEDFAEDNWGKHKVPTLRNVDKRVGSGTKAYGHNGYFKSLIGIVHFYNTRDAKPTCPGPYTEAQALAANCWPAPEVMDTVNTTELGDLHLTPAQEAAIVAFMKTLSDGYGR